MSYCEHKTQQEEIDCKYCTSDEFRDIYYSNKVSKVDKNCKELDAKGILYSAGNREYRRKLAKQKK